MFGWKEARQQGAWFVTAVDSAHESGGVEVGDRILTLIRRSALRGGRNASSSASAVRRRPLPAGRRAQRSTDRKDAHGVGRPEEAWTLPGLLFHEPHLVLRWRVHWPRATRRPRRTGGVRGSHDDRRGMGERRRHRGSAISSSRFTSSSALISFRSFPTGRRLTGAWKWSVILGYCIAMVPPVLTWWLEGTLLIAGLSGSGRARDES